MLGKTFKTFAIKELIAKGGMGEVYLAIQSSLDRQVALKILKKQSVSHEIIERFIQEAKLAASIQHPNIVNIYEVGKEDNFYYIAMEYVEGESIEDRIVEGSVISELATWRIALQVSQSLQAALKKGIIHRDIKPANILLTSDNVAKVADFGLSKNTSQNSNLTHDGIILGTPNYMSPEHIEGKGIDYRSDIYSLGATVYCMLTGKILFTGETIVDILYKHKYNKVIPPEEFCPQLRYETSLILAKMLAKDSEKRYASYSDLIADIDALLNEKPLFFAQNSDAMELYELNTETEKKYSISKASSANIMNSVFNIFAKNQKEKNTLSLLLIDNFSTPLKTNLTREFSARITLAGTLLEVKRCIQKETNGIVINSEFLGVQTIDFLSELKEIFPDLPIIILLENLPKIKQESKSLFLTSDMPNKELAQKILKTLYEKPFYAKNIDLNLIITLTKSKRWTTKIKLNEGKANEESILLKSGTITKTERSQEEIRKYIEKTNVWKVDKEKSPSSHTLFQEKVSEEYRDEEPTEKMAKIDYPFYQQDQPEEKSLQPEEKPFEEKTSQKPEANNTLKEFQCDLDTLITQEVLDKIEAKPHQEKKVISPDTTKQEQTSPNEKFTNKKESKDTSSEKITIKKNNENISDLFERLADRAEKDIEKKQK